jgi:hypothetical protein
MEFVVSKNNIKLHDNFFSSLEDAEDFGREWLEINVIQPLSALTDKTLTKVKWYNRKGKYYQIKKVVVEYTYIWHTDLFDIQYTEQRSVNITGTNHERLWMSTGV